MPISRYIVVAVARCSWACSCSYEPKALAQVDRRPRGPPLIIQRLGETLGFPEMVKHRFRLAEREEGASEIEAQIDRLLQRLTGLW